MYKQFTAFLSAAVLCLSAMPLSAAAEETETLPAWVPVTFAQAMQFSNQYGKTHTADGYVCTVQRQSLDIRHLYSTEWDADSPQIEPVYQEKLAFSSLPEQPDASDEEAYSAYLQELAMLGIQEGDINYLPMIFAKPDFIYEVTVYKPEADIAFTWVDHFNWQGAEEVRTSFSFAVDGGEIRETDLFGWLPDCVQESNAYRKENPTVAVKNDCVIYCDSVAEDGGGQLLIEQTGTAKLKQVMRCKCETNTLVSMEPGGNGGNTIIVYRPVTSGTVRFRFLQAQPWNLTEVWKKDGKCFRVAEDLSMTEITAEELERPLMGDCNDDGVFGVTDVVMCQKFVHGMGKLTVWENADFDGDGAVDAIDLALMQRSLLMQQMETPELIRFTTADKTLHREDAEDHRSFKACLVRSTAELQALVGEEALPDEITGETFADHAVVVIETPATGSNYYQELNVDEVTRIGGTLTVHATNHHPDACTPDMAYWRQYLTIPASEAEYIKAVKVQCMDLKME